MGEVWAPSDVVFTAFLVTTWLEGGGLTEWEGRHDKDQRLNTFEGENTNVRRKDNISRTCSQYLIC